MLANGRFLALRFINSKVWGAPRRGALRLQNRRASISSFQVPRLTISQNSERLCTARSSVWQLLSSKNAGSRRSLIARAFCAEASPAGILESEGWPEHDFLRVAEDSLECISEVVSQLGFDSANAPNDFDIDLSQGVLTISLGSEGTYVLNTQTPNRQIWMSSPSSGPWRYAWKLDEKQWVSTRDGHPLSARLTEELSEIFKEAVVVSFKNVAF